ncbi:MAG: chromosome segregation protein SMC [Chloroflexota bacterium]
MYLKALEIQGYKSFANKVEFVFDQGITAVVGPNGSGKSNVADAIRWVLGEQSYSNLRGKKTEDMIFSGSAARARLGMAAATLVLDNTDKWLPLDFSEVTISRRAYRSGENEYYFNGSRVRLKDVAEILAKSGLSRQTYTVIGQGTIDQVLSLHADERRALFEEAAGITFHRKKRAETLARLEATRGNLIRLNDIVKEIEPRLNRLEKQAERAEEFSHLNADLEALLRLWYGYRWRQSQQQLREATARLRQDEAAVETQRRELRRLEQQLGQGRAGQSEARAQLGTWYSGNKQLYTQAEAIRRELAVSEERARHYAAQRQEILAELEPLRLSLVEEERRVAQAQEKLLALNQEVAGAEAAAHSVRQQLAAHQAERQNLVARQTEAEQQVRQLEAGLTERRSRLAQFAERRETLQTEQSAGEAEIARLRDQQQELQSRQTQLAAQLAAIDHELVRLEAGQSQQRDHLTQLNQAAEQLKAGLIGLESKESALKARQDLLARLRTDMSGYYDGVRAVLQPEAGLAEIIGPLSQLVRAPAGLDLAIETALGGRLQDVVVRSFAQAEAAINYLKQTGSGRATFLPLDTIRPGGAAAVPATPGVIGLASELVEVEPGLRPVVELTLNRTVVVEDLPAARRAFKAMQGGFQIVTRDGELMRSGGAVTGGRTKSKAGQEGTFLAREREWRELPDQLAALSRSHQALSGQLADRHEQANLVRQKIQGLSEEQQQQTARRQDVQAAADKANRLLEQLQDSIGWQQDLQAKAGAELSRLAERQTAVEQELVQLAQARQLAAATATQLAAEVQAVSAESLLAELSQAQTALATVQGRRQSQQAILTAQQTALRQLAGQIEAKQARVQSLAAEREALLQQQQDLQQRHESFSGRLAELAANIAAVERQLADLEQRQSQLEEIDNNQRQRLHWLETEQNRASLEAARRQDELDNLQHQIQDDLGLVSLEMSDEQVGQPVLPIRPLVSNLPAVEELPPGVEEDVKRLKVQIRRLGQINPDAPREYADLHERHTFLSGQITDLETAAADLKEIITRLDQSMREAFVDTFDRVAKEFQRYFKALFGGGEAQLLLTDPHNLIETGVDIVAKPPGKRLQSLALLSGGERSLTAQALIFALLRTSPTPFVIFDEVDAMLDEANVGRFRDALVGLARDIQFIIITHNRRTIEAANTIYGISMGNDSVSQAYSLKIEDWLENGPG